MLSPELREYPQKIATSATAMATRTNQQKIPVLRFPVGWGGPSRLGAEGDCEVWREFGVPAGEAFPPERLWSRFLFHRATVANASVSWSQRRGHQEKTHKPRRIAPDPLRLSSPCRPRRCQTTPSLQQGREARSGRLGKQVCAHLFLNESLSKSFIGLPSASIRLR